MLRQGNQAPDFTLPVLEGGTFSLSEELKGGKNVILVFLRHLG